jgi:cytochrome c oxidase cbb3-type subunit III
MRTSVTRRLPASGLALVLASSLAALAACDGDRGNPRDAAPARPASAEHVRTSTLVPGGPHADTGVDRPNPYSGDARAIREGERLFDWFNCSGCHAGGGGGMGPPLMDRQWIYGQRPVQLYDSIVSGRPNGMPAFGAMIPPQQVWQIIAYIETMGGMGPGKDERRGEGRNDPPPPKAEPERSAGSEGG